jgi:predicted nucleic acid-binding Zn finger protein
MPLSVLEELQKTGVLTPEMEDRIIEEFGSRGKNAIDLVRAHSVKKYKDFFVVQGKSGEYIVEDDFCTCNDYLYRLSIKGGVCYHSIAVRIAKATGEYEPIDQWYYDIIGKKPS